MSAFLQTFREGGWFCPEECTSLWDLSSILRSPVNPVVVGGGGGTPSSVLFCVFKPLCPAPMMGSAVYVQGPLKRPRTAPWLRSSAFVSLATGGRENRTCHMENVSYSRSGGRKGGVGRREERGEEWRGRGGRAGRGPRGLPPPRAGAPALPS